MYVDTCKCRLPGNPLDGILSLATYLQSQLSSRSRRSAGIQTPDVNGLVLDFANDTLRTMYPSETVLKTLMDGLASLPPTSLSDDDLLRMLSIYEVRALTVATATSCTKGLYTFSLHSSQCTDCF